MYINPFITCFTGYIIDLIRNYVLLYIFMPFVSYLYRSALGVDAVGVVNRKFI